METDCEIKIRTVTHNSDYNKNNIETKFADLRLHSKKIITDLAKYSIVQNKTFTYEFGKNIPDEYMFSYIMGSIDGDGSISYHDTIKNNNEHKYRLATTLTGNKQFIEGYIAFIKKHLNISGNIKLEHRCENTYKVTYYSKDSLTILDKCYENVSCQLDRKKERYLAYKNIVNSVVSLHNSGVSISDISSQLKLSNKSISNIIDKNNT